MSCNDLSIEDLVAHSDGELSAESAARVETHVSACGECARELDLLRRSGDLISELPGMEPSAGFAEGVLHAASEPALKPAGRLRRLAPVPIAAAAALVLALLGGGLWLGARGGPNADTVLSAKEENEIARDLYLLSNLEALRENDPDALVAIVDELDVLEDRDLDTNGDGDGEDGG